MSNTNTDPTTDGQSAKTSADTTPETPASVNPSAEVDGETPLVVLPRGGAREVGRSCYQVETQHGTYLVDCGLNQGSGGQFPDFRGLDTGQIDAVFLTHAHIDHSGGLPVLEARGLLAPDAKVICTQPTAALVHTLLHDSLKIHQEEAKKPGRDRKFTRDDVEQILDRFEPLSGYNAGRLTDHVPLPDESLQYEFGNAGHLLGSAWLMLEGSGRRVVFSGDLGGRSAHLPDIDEPPTADTLFLESTYGNRDTHSSFSDARTELYQEAITAIEQGIPVLIPTFAVGRAQEILQIFRERWRDLPEETQEQLEIIYDGMATEATDRYHAFASPEYISDNVFNYMQNAADFEPFAPEIAERPSNSSDRVSLFDGANAPIIVSPSGMLTGGLSPAYLLELVEHYDEARVLFTGYQAEGTPGRDLQGATGGTVTTTVQAWPIQDPDDQPDDDDTDIDETSADGSAFDGPPDRTIEVPASWIRTIDGLSGHAARNRLLQFAREVDAGHIALIHGEPHIQESMRDHLDGNVDADAITRAAMQTLVPVHSPTEDVVAAEREAAHTGETAVTADAIAESDNLTPVADDTSTETANGDSDQLSTRTGMTDEEFRTYVLDRLDAIERELAAIRNDDGRSEAELRDVIRDEVEVFREEVDATDE